MSKGAASTGGVCRWSSLSKAFARTTSKNLDTKNGVLRARGIASHVLVCVFVLAQAAELPVSLKRWGVGSIRSVVHSL